MLFLAPVGLVIHLARRSGEGLKPFGLGTATLTEDVAWGTLGALGVAAVGLGIYLGAIALNVNRFVVPIPPLGHWWTVPVLALGALQNGLLEEVVAVGYLIHRLEQVRWPSAAAIGASAGRLMRQFLAESLVLSVAGFAGGCAFAFFGLKIVVATIPEGPLPDEAVIGLNPTVLLLSLGITVLTIFLCGLAPALLAMRGDLPSRLASSGRSLG